MSSTVSEQLFVTLCNSLALNIEKIPETLTKTPDYKVTAKGCVFHAEVKDLRPNDEERRLLDEFRDKKSVSVSSQLGHRAWGMIDQARYQLKAVREQRLPGIIVLYDNIKLDDGTNLGPHGPLSPDHITAAMFGKWIVDLKIENGTGNVIARNDRCGPNESFNYRMKSYVSAVAVICDYFVPLTMTLYHNPYAEHPLPISVFNGANCRNFKVTIEEAKRPQSWVGCV